MGEEKCQKDVKKGREVLQATAGEQKQKIPRCVSAGNHKEIILFCQIFKKLCYNIRNLQAVI